MMPKEKAEELYWKYYHQTEHYLLQKDESKVAKICALICCDEILLTLNKDIQDINVVGNILLDLIEYWNNVKEELLKM